MKQLWIGLVLAGSLVACRNGPNNARDTTGMGSGGTAGGSLPVPAETAGMSGGTVQPPPTPAAAAPESAPGATTPSTDTMQGDTSAHRERSRKHRSK